MNDGKVKVIVWGFGAMGGGMAEMLLEKEGVVITGVCDKHPDRVGKTLRDALDQQGPVDDSNGHVTGRHIPDIVIQETIHKILDAPDFLGAHVALVATDSFTAKTFDKLKLLIERGINVISTAEEMSYPGAAEPELAREIDKLAREHGVTVLGTGINPGLIMDLLVVMLTGACRRVDQVTARRVNSLSPFGPAVMEEQGVGLSPADFRRRAAEGTLSGHVGFHESIAMICDALGWKLDAPPKQSMEPIISSVARKTRYAAVGPGMVAGCDMQGSGTVGGEKKVVMEHPQQIEPHLEGAETGDYISIKGEPDINFSIKPEVPGGIGTIAMCVNMIPHVINGAPGLKTMLDLPVPRAIMGDMRDTIEPGRLHKKEKK